MYKQERTDHFIDRTEEIDTFTCWLTDPNAPRILYIHDAAEASDKKGGVGKTWLLRKCRELAEQMDPDGSIVMVDFFNVGDRGRNFLEEKIITKLQKLYPTWTPKSFTKAVQQYCVAKHRDISSSGNNGSADTKIREVLSTALAEDLRRLDAYLAQEQKTLLGFFDTFEAIEQNPAVAVVLRSQGFPDTYQFERMRVVIAGRNKLDWTNPNWRGRKQEIQDISLKTPYVVRITQVCSKRKWSSEVLAQKLGGKISRRTIRDWKLGKSCPNLDNRIKLCKLFCVSYEDMCFPPVVSGPLVQSQQKNGTDLRCLFFAIAIAVLVIVGSIALLYELGLPTGAMIIEIVAAIVGVISAVVGAIWTLLK